MDRLGSFELIHLFVFRQLLGNPGILGIIVKAAPEHDHEVNIKTNRAAQIQSVYVGAIHTLCYGPRQLILIERFAKIRRKFFAVLSKLNDETPQRRLFQFLYLCFSDYHLRSVRPGTTPLELEDPSGNYAS